MSSEPCTDARDIRSGELRAGLEKAEQAVRRTMLCHAGEKIVAVLDIIEGKAWMGPLGVDRLFVDPVQAREVDRRIRSLRERLASRTEPEAANE